MSFKKQLAIFVIATLIIIGGGIALSTKQQASAQLGGLVVWDTATFQQMIKESIEKKTTTIWQQLKTNLFYGALKTYLNNIAYDSASYIASGGAGGSALLDVRQRDKILQDAGNAALGEAIGELSDLYFKDLGIDLCDPSAEVKARLTLGIIDTKHPPEPKCDIRDVQKQWQQFGESLSSGQWLSRATIGLSSSQKSIFISGYFDPAQNDLGAFLKLQDYAFKKELEAIETEKITAVMCQGYVDKKTPVTGEIVTHCQDVHNINVNQGQLLLQESELSSAGSIFLNAAKLFGNTLYSKFLKNLIGGGYSLTNAYKWFEDDGTGNIRDSLINKLRGNVDAKRGVTDFKAIFNVADVQRIDDYQYLDELGACPQDRRIATQNNCTLDLQFLTAVNNRETVAEALAKGHLNPNFPLISYLNASVNGSKDCFQNNYCYSNIAKLRKFRILPLGWEIAASLSPVDRPITLGEAISCFDNGSGCILEPSKNIFFRLIDPNWVLAAPVSQCKALVYGPTLTDVTSNERQQTCVDHPSCLAEDGKGNCVGGYGYCTQEQSIWRFEGRQCQAEFASCNIFTNTESGARSTFLSDTIDFCDPSQGGCLWYSRSKVNFGTEESPAINWNPADKIFLNNKASDCPSDAAGCAEFINPIPGVNLLANGNFDSYTLNSATDYSTPDWLDDDLSDDFQGWIANGIGFSLYTTKSQSYFGLSGLRMKGDGQLTAQVNTGLLSDQTVTVSFYAKASNDCTVNASIGSLSTPAVSVPAQLTHEWQRFTLSHTFDPNNADLIATVFLQSSVNCNDTLMPVGEQGVFVDGVKLEIGNSSTSYSSYGDGGLIHLKANQASCQQEEVGCTLYTPLNGDPAVPGIVNQNDVCPAECVGYNTFLRLPNGFEELEAIATSDDFYNFIPQTAITCPASESGCSEFTNLDEVALGGEGKHYYSYVRQCVDESQGTTYYTLEGNGVTGFQVRTWQVLKNADDNGPCTNIAVGGDTCTDTLDTRVAATCDGELGINPDCREFYDLDGASWFLLQSKVIFASSDCHPLRRTDTGAIYNGVDADSHYCQAANVSCSEYRGNKGNNVRTLFLDGFETGTYAPWSGVSLSTEAVTQGGHSIEVGLSSARPIPNMIVAGREYYISFWRKGEVSRAQISINGLGLECASATKKCIFDGGTIKFTKDDWRLYQFGPIYVEKVDDPVNVMVNFFNESNYLIDNVALKELTGNLFVKHNSWNTPDSCNQPFEGAMLGCQSYKTQNKDLVNLKSFSQVCREAAVGCQSVINTFNSDSPFTQTWHAGDASEITVPSDKVDFVVVSNKNSCSPSYQGCTELGKPDLNRDLPVTDPTYVKSYQSVYRIIDPDRFDDILCLESGLFCQEYTDSNSSAVFFRDPGDRTCSYRDGISINGVLFTGWFKTDSLLPGVSPVGCYSDGIPPFTPDHFRIRQNNENDYDGWVATCPSSQAQCTEFIDTQSAQGPELFTNADFTTNRDGWVYGAGFGNTLPAVTGFTPNPATKSAALRINPHGLVVIKQYNTSTDPDLFTGAELLTNADMYTLSGEIKVNSWLWDASDPKQSYASVIQRCYWDSPYDTDYCASVDPNDWQNVTFNLSEPCESNADCAGTGSPYCYKTTEKYCDNGVTGERSLDVCNNTGDCAALGYSADWTCGAKAGSSTTDSSGLRRDHYVDYAASADLTAAETTSPLYGQWQQLNVTINIGSQSQGDELSYCSAGVVAVNNATGWPAPLPSGDSEIEVRNLSFREAESYYYFNEDSLNQDDCNGRVSERAGCVLFDDTSSPNKRFNSYLTYLESDKSDGAFVSPVVCDPNSVNPLYRNCSNDANRIIKVRPDRQCQEWLACKSTTQIFDPQSNSFRQICNDIGLCNEWSANGSVLNCNSWVDGDPSKLDFAKYVSRDITFNGTEYSGYSMYNQYPVDELEMVDISTDPVSGRGVDSRNPDYRLVYLLKSGTDYAAADYNKACDQTGLNPVGIGVVKGDPRVCAVGVDGSRFATISPYVVAETARGFAEATSPLPNSVVSGDITDRSYKFGFQSANVCETDENIASCEEGYYKMQYGLGNLTSRYYAINGPLDGSVIPSCICDGGSNDGKPCAPVNERNATTVSEQSCPAGGSPIYLRRSDSYLNWPGYCLEEDKSTNLNGSSSEFACLTWLPVDTTPAGIDFFNQNREAGYSYQSPTYYCLEFGLKETRTMFTTTACMESTKNVDDKYVTVDRVTDEVIAKVRENELHSGHYAKVSEAGVDHYTYFVTEGDECGGGWFETDNYLELHPIIGASGCEGPELFRAKGYSVTKECIADYDGATFYVRNRDSGGAQAGDSAPFTVCTTIAEAVTPRGENAAKTNLFWSEYQVNFDKGGPFKADINYGGVGEYSVTRDSSPFGAAVPGAGFRPGDFELWKIRAASEEPPRAGSPYACSSAADNCVLLSVPEDPAYVTGWEKEYPGYVGDESYVDGAIRLKQIFRKIFGVYQWEVGSDCNFSVCDGGIKGGITCQSSASCKYGVNFDPKDPPVPIDGENVCLDYSNHCINSAYGKTRTCTPCPSGFTRDAETMKCVSDVITGSFQCLVACTTPKVTYPDDNYHCEAVDLVADTWICLSDPLPQVNSECIVKRGDTLDCRKEEYDSDYRCYDDIRHTYLNVVCDSDDDCRTESPSADLAARLSLTSRGWITASGSKRGIVAYLNQNTFCAPENGYYCTGADFGFVDNNSTAQSYLKKPVECFDDYTNLLGQTLIGFDHHASATSTPGYEICNAPNALCKQANLVMMKDDTDKDDDPATLTVPFCQIIADTYQPLCDPDVDNPIPCTPSNVIDDRALPLDSTPSQDKAIDVATDIFGAGSPEVTAITSRSQTYEQKDGTPTAINRYTEDVAHGPFISAVDCDVATGVCQPGSFYAFSINDLDSGVIQTEESKLLANLSFYMAAYKDRMPIRYIDIDWGDGSRQRSLGYYKNALPQCTALEKSVVPADWTATYDEFLQFAGISQACEETPKQYFHLYNYNAAYDSGTGYAEYFPKVAVQDNWGWCTNDQWNEVGLLCDNGYIQFSGSIKVARPN